MARKEDGSVMRTIGLNKQECLNKPKNELRIWWEANAEHNTGGKLIHICTWMYASGEEGLVDEAQKAMEEAEALKKVTSTYQYGYGYFNMDIYLHMSIRDLVWCQFWGLGALYDVVYHKHYHVEYLHTCLPLSPYPSVSGVYKMTGV